MLLHRICPHVLPLEPRMIVLFTTRKQLHSGTVLASLRDIVAIAYYPCDAATATPADIFTEATVILIEHSAVQQYYPVDPPGAAY
jgi:hypothetical protein